MTHSQLVNRIRKQTLASEARRCSGCNFVGEVATMVSLPICFDRRGPLPVAAIPGHTAKLRCRGRDSRDILAVSIPRHRAQVAPTIVKSVSVLVVSLDAVTMLQAEQFPVHSDGTDPPECKSFVRCSPANGIPLVVQIPEPLSGPICVISVDDDEPSNRSILSVDRNSRRSVLMDRRRNRRKLTRLGTEHRSLPVPRHLNRDATSVARDAYPVYLGLPAARTATESAAASANAIRSGQERLATLLANAGDGTLTGHHDLLSRGRGARRRAVQPVSAPIRVNYTTYQIGGVVG